MKAIIRVTDMLDGKSVTLEVAIANGDMATELNKAVRKQGNREYIIRELRLSFGEARLELLCDGKLVAEGKMVNNAFSGRGTIETRNCRKAANYQS